MRLDSIVLATHNDGKRRELQTILASVLGPVEVLTAGDLGLPDIAETEVTFAGNALLKGRAAAAATGLPAIADDSGLAVEVMGGAPGFLSARWSGRHGDDRANLELLLAQLADVPDGQRGAAFRCAAAFVGTNGIEIVREGEMTGTIARQALGDNGFGYDPIFIPAGQDLSAAQMSPEQKNQRSHRRRAFEALGAALARK